MCALPISILNDSNFSATVLAFTQAGVDESCGGGGATALGAGEPNGHFQLETISLNAGTGYGTVIDTGVVADTNWHKIRIRSNTVGTILFTLYDSTGVIEMDETPISTNVDASTNFSPMAQIVSRTGSVSMQFDYWGFKAAGLSR